MDDTARHRITRIRRETRRRMLTVASVESRGDTLLRVWFIGDDLAGFVSEAPDDHIKLFLPDGAGGVVARDYTPRHFDATTQSLAIEFAVHDHGVVGPATLWAVQAKAGDTLEIGGPRGSTVIADDFDWYLLVGDETAIPAIGRRIEELRSDAEIIVVAAIERGAARPPLPDRAKFTVTWLDRDETGQGILDALVAISLPPGEGFVWIAAEAGIARSARRYMVEVRGHPQAWVKASGYWVAGEAGAHTKIDG